MSQSFPITVVMQDDSNLIASFYVQHDQKISDIKTILEAQWGISAASLSLNFNGRLLNDNDRLNAIDVNNNDLLQAEIIRQPSMLHSGEDMLRAQAQSLRNQIKNNAQLQNELNHQSRAIACSIE